MPWLGRWCSCDPAGLTDGTNIYFFTRNNPIRFHDPEGRQSNDSIITQNDIDQLSKEGIVVDPCTFHFQSKATEEWEMNNQVNEKMKRKVWEKKEMKHREEYDQSKGGDM